MRKMKYLYLLSYLSVVCSYKILVVFPYPGKSHTILGEGYVKHLLRAGHEVTYITPVLLKPHPKLRQVDVSSNTEKFTLTKLLDIDRLLKKEVDFSDMRYFYHIMMQVGNTSITHENVQKFLMEDKEKYDVVIAEWLYTELYCGFAAIFNAPYIWSTSLEPHPMIMTLIDEIHNPAYTPDHVSPITPPLTFSQRVGELWRVLSLYYDRWFLKDIEEKTFADAYGPAASKRGITLPSLEELKHNSAMIIGNSHVSLGQALRFPQNYIPVAGYHIDDEIKPLPEDLQKILDNAPNGVIYFSLGTMMPSKTMPDELKIELLKLFSGLKQTVIWKLEEEFKNLPKNVHIVKWAPQQSILAHPKCILFITHGGLLSTTEALHFEVPVIGIPLFFDQSINVLRAVQKGFGLKVDMAYDMPGKLKVAIDEMLTNPKYRQKVKELSLVYHHRPVKPGDALIHWVEHVVKTRGAHHLRSPGFLIPLNQRLYLDLIALILVVLTTIVLVVKRLMGKGKTDDLKKKNK